MRLIAFNRLHLSQFSRLECLRLGRSRLAAVPILLFVASALLSSVVLPSCAPGWQGQGGAPHEAIATAAVRPLSTPELLEKSWTAYRDRFIQGDGRIIDREAADRTTSEAQAYALLRAVLMDDADTFARVLNWGENNLQRRGLDGQRRDYLWAWQWGRNDDNQWLPLDANFASDGDIDAVTALIFAARQWRRSEYLDLAKLKLRDLWNLSVVKVGDRNYLIPGPREVFQQSNQLYLNPSYFAPYAFRLFAQIDAERDWLSLIKSSYQTLNNSARLSSLGLPSNWIALDTTKGQYQPITQPENLNSRYGYDAYRVWWRVALDAAWFNERQAKRYLQDHLEPLVNLWQTRQAIPAEINLQGQPLVSYESNAQYAMLYAAFKVIDPEIAEQMRLQKLLPAFRDGFWENDSAYYIQNLGWLGLYPPDDVASHWLKP